ncbi:uncharacterized protein BJ171DRAFT_505819 [Polychytrium aggregatum]|uniref:uncharacterized protein n=1 Tax=Polychytrium aggregatum TaxID=110093 RepID=UPI0022FE679F|nr:uncharacterized protein BJ171DRAFT_505819 [Polychytrium aggregatum]KAI9204428.1 hypothetical protein BJ171DRAFT_505819 [Polychytrium aggregatum]
MSCSIDKTLACFIQATRTADGYVDQYGHYQDLGWSSRSNLDAWRSAGFHEPSPDFPTELLDDAPRYGRLLNNPGNYMADDHVDTTYEGLWALSERIGSAKSKSTPLYMIDRLPVVKYQVGMLMGDDSRCTICLTEFEVGEMLKRLPCTHAYHGECINRWLRMHEQCPICRISVTDTLDPQKPEPLMPQ